MINQAISLYDWANGVIMLAIFGFICIVLVVVLLVFMFGGKKKENKEQ